MSHIGTTATGTTPRLSANTRHTVRPTDHPNGDTDDQTHGSQRRGLPDHARRDLTVHEANAP